MASLKSPNMAGMPSFTNSVTLFKELADPYFSWALSLCALSQGHLFVDLLPHGKEIVQIREADSDILASRFELACKYYLDTRKVVTLRCCVDLLPDHIYYCFVDFLRSRTSNNTGNTGQSKAQRMKKTHAIDNIMKSAASEGDDLVVFILQDCELLPHETKLALIEIMEKRYMPISSIQNTYNHRGPPLLQRGHFEIEVPFMIVGLSTKFAVTPNLYPDARSFLQAFSMRIPLKLPTHKWTDFLDFHYAQSEMVKLHDGYTSKKMEAFNSLLWESDKNNSEAMYFRIKRLDFKYELNSVTQVHISSDIHSYIRNLISALRMHSYVFEGPSTKVSHIVAIFCKAHAFLRGRHDGPEAHQFALPMDVQQVVVEILAHQITLMFREFAEQIDDTVASNGKSHPVSWNEVAAARFFVAAVAQNLPI